MKTYKHLLSRKQFWPWIILCTALVIAVQLLLQYLFNQLPTIDDYYSFSSYYLDHGEIMSKKYGYLFLEFLLLAPLACWSVWLQAGRLHDIGKSAHTIWWRIIPIIGDIYLIYLFCKPTPAIYQYNKQEDASYSENGSNHPTNPIAVTPSKTKKSTSIKILVAVTILFGIVAILSLVFSVAVDNKLFGRIDNSSEIASCASVIGMLSVVFCLLFLYFVIDKKDQPASVFPTSSEKVSAQNQADNASVYTDIDKDKTYKVEESAFRKARDRVDILKTVTILLATVLVFLAIICPFCLKSIETRLDKTPSYQIVERATIRTEYADSKVGFIVALSIFFLLTVVSLCFLIKSIKDFRNIKRNPQAFLHSQTKQQVENVSLQKNTIAAPHDAASLQRIAETNAETSAPSHIKESELLAAYRAHPELQAGIDALLGIQNKKTKPETK